MLRASRTPSPALIALSALMVTVVVAAVMAVGTAPTRYGATPDLAGRGASAPQEPTNFHGSGGDALDWGTPGITLEAALSQMRGTVVLPPASVVGTPEKVVLDETARDAAGYPGVLILYSSGTKLFIAPGEKDLARDAAEPSAPFEDKRSKAFELVTERGRTLMVMRGGVQVIRAGARAEVMPRIYWNLNGHTYAVIGASRDVTIGDLMTVVNAIE